MEKPLMEINTSDPAGNVRALTAMGLSDPYTWCRTHGELSCGQQARHRLKLALDTDAHTLVLDEAFHALDETTAAAVAWAAQKTVRKQRRRLIVCTTRPEIAKHLQPDIVIGCNWTPTPDITYPTHTAVTSPLLDSLTIEKGTHRDWAALAHMHYAAGDPATVHSYWAAKIPGLPGPAAVAVYSFPDLHSGARNLATDDAYKISGSRENAMKMNREVKKLSRIVVSPEVRGIGLARRLIQATAPKLGAQYVECVAAMGTYMPFLRSAGFKELPQAPSEIEGQIYAAVEEDRCPPHVMLDPAALEDWIENLSVRDSRKWRRLVWHHWHHFAIHRRTRAPRPQVIPGPNDQRWPDAMQLMATRMGGRPSYWILGPLDEPAKQTE